jgi:hypothetical protein
MVQCFTEFTRFFRSLCVVTPNVTCANCGKAIYRKPSYVKRFNVMFCCQACYGAALKSGLVKHNMPQRPKTGRDLECVICGKEFYRSAFWIERGVDKTCGSTECKSKYFSGSRNSFWGRITKPETLARLDSNRVIRHRHIFTRVQRKEWKEDRCKWCGSTSKLTLDHIIPVFDGGTNVRTNAQTLCHKCNLWKFHYVDVPRFVASQ